MASGLIAGITGAGTVTYTPSVLTKFNVIANCTTTASLVNINGVNMNLAASTTISFSIWSALNVTNTFVSSTSTNLLVTALESGY